MIPLLVIRPEEITDVDQLRGKLRIAFASRECAAASSGWPPSGTAAWHCSGRLLNNFN